MRATGELDLPLAVRGGGHSVAGHSMPEDAVVIDLSLMRGVTVDPTTQTAEALGGSLLMDLDVATAAHGLAVPSGTFFDTGVGGLTLSGGISYLVASEGFACDALIGAELVTADGSIVQVDEAREPDLLWALRGGGGNFGVVTRLRYRLTTVGPMYGGRPALPRRGPAGGPRAAVRARPIGSRRALAPGGRLALRGDERRRPDHHRRLARRRRERRRGDPPAA